MNPVLKITHLFITYVLHISSEIRMMESEAENALFYNADLKTTQNLLLETSRMKVWYSLWHNKQACRDVQQML